LQVVEGYLNTADKYEAHYRLIVGESAPSYTSTTEAIAASQKAFSRLNQGGSILLPAAASFQGKQKTALQEWALVHGFVSLNHLGVSNVLALKGWNGLALLAMATHTDGIILRASGAGRET
jgi:hypothetical protein